MFNKPTLHLLNQDLMIQYILKTKLQRDKTTRREKGFLLENNAKRKERETVFEKVKFPRLIQTFHKFAAVYSLSLLVTVPLYANQRTTCRNG